MGGERQENVEIARRSATDAGLAFAGKPNAGAIFHALRNVDRQCPLARYPSRARAGRTGIFDHLAAALTAGAGSLQREKSLRLPHPAGAAAHRAGLRLGAGLGAGARTGFAGHRDRDLDLRGLAEEGFLQRDFHVVAQVLAALAPAATSALPGHAEQIFENIREGRGKASAEAGTAAARALFESGMTEPVIGRALVAVFEDFVGFVDFLETDFAVGIAGILVRMPFHRQLAERRLELGLVRSSVDFKGFIVAALGGHPSNPPEIRPHPEGTRRGECSLRLNEK